MLKTPMWQRRESQRLTNRMTQFSTPICLNGRELGQLSDSWEIWTEQAPTTGRKIARLRLHTIFLLIRYGGLRLGEAFNFQLASDLDCQSGLIHIGGSKAREIILPVPPMRLLRPAATLEEARQKDFLRLDPGFCRKIFYTVAEMARVNPKLAGPRALRKARALELINLHMPLNLVWSFLGLTNSQKELFHD